MAAILASSLPFAISDYIWLNGISFGISFDTFFDTLSSAILMFLLRPFLVLIGLPIISGIPTAYVGKGSAKPDECFISAGIGILVTLLIYQLQGGLGPLLSPRGSENELRLPSVFLELRLLSDIINLVIFGGVIAFLASAYWQSRHVFSSPSAKNPKK